MNMSEKKSAEDPRPQNNPSYLSRVFQESSVGMVSSLFQTNSVTRRIFKVLALLLCLFGFLYQSGQFLAAVFQYPTTVDVEIKRPDILNVPGYTFCDNNGISRSIFCKEYPDYCEEATESFCQKFDYCEGNITLMPKKEYFEINRNMTLEEMIKVNVNFDEFAEITQQDGDEYITGPFLRKLNFFRTFHLCYSFNDRINNSLLPRTSQLDKLSKPAVNKFSFTIRSEDIFVPGTRPGIMFSVHSPFEAVNPLQNGIFMKAGRTYMIFVSMDEEVLLQYPYPTDCVNYTEQWEKRGRTGPRTQNMCIQECLIDLSMLCYNCVISPPFHYPTTHRMCLEQDLNSEKCNEEDLTKADDCEKKCRDDCRRTKYSYTVQERYTPYLVENMESEDDIFTKIDVEIYLEGDEIVVLKHSPKYMFVEVFSNIGGFIGCWLGISLLGIFDIFEGFFRIFIHSTKVKKGSVV